jgi:ubiquinone/menaquinone biosynthesis C-methylase UbiE
MAHDFDRWSKTYERSWMQRFIFDPAHRRLSNAVSASVQPRRLLDLGCGTGRLLRKARERWPQAELIGVDPSEGMIEKARQLTPGVEFYVAGAEALPLPDNSVDLVFSTASFHHWSDQLQGVREVARVLRPSGQFCLGDLRISPLMARIGAWLSPTSGHASVNTLSKAQELFAQAGLEVQQHQASWTRFQIVGQKR